MKSTFPLLLAGAVLLPLGACATHGSRQTSSAATQTSPSPDNSAATTGSSAASTDQAASSYNSGAVTGPSTAPNTASSMAQPQTIVAKIKSEMAAQDVASMPDISVDSDSSGAVVLSGTAQSQEDIDRALSIARSTAGVTSVTNDIKVKSPG